MDVHHIFICVDPEALEADVLLDFGLKEGTSSRHPGQGTANRRFFFHNFMLELLWMEHPQALQSKRSARTQLWERFCGAGHATSPFGVGFRPGAGDEAAAPFSAWKYRPRYLPYDVAIEVGENVPLAEPMWFFLAHGVRPDSQAALGQPLDHPAGLKVLDRAHIRVHSEAALSAPARAAVDSGWVRLRPAEDALLELEFDGCRHFERHDFRPRLPLLIRW